MQFIPRFTHALLMFVAPLTFIGYRPTPKQKLIFTLAYGLGVGYSRKIYGFFDVPFGTHTVLMMALYALLLKMVLKDNMTWIKSICTSLIMVILLLINDSLIMLPVMRLFHLTIQGVEHNVFLSALLPDLILVIIYIVGCLRNRRHEETAFNAY